MNTYKTSYEERIKKSVIDHRVRWAKKAALTKQFNEHGYNFCENTLCSHPNMPPLDCAHIISVNECQKQGKSELAWDIKNIKILCRTCHQWYDGLNLKFKSNEK